MAAHTITITVTPFPPTGAEESFTYSPSTLRVAPGDTVRWESLNGPFVIMFTLNTPIKTSGPAGGLVIDAHSTPAGPPWTTPIFSVPAGTLGHFHYAVALALLSSVGQAATVHIDAGCPEIIAN
jgi:hypothetical protein